jgi:hypothetical protein
MIEESKKIEFWNFLTTEKNQPRPKGITTQRLAVIKPAILGSDDLWLEVIENHGAGDRAAAEFYQSREVASVQSRADFWEAVRTMIAQDENKRIQLNKRTAPENRTRGKVISRNNRRK